MIRKSRLVKVTFGCCAVIFLILQFLDHSTEPKDAPVVEPVNPSGHPLQQPLASSEVNTHPTKPVNLNLSSPSPPLVPSKSSSSSAASAASEAASSSVLKKAENEVSEEIVKEPRSSLSGERIHGLPNETALPLSSQNSQHNLPSSGQILTEIPKILAQIKRINEEQSIKNEDIFGPVTNATVVIAIQVHNRLQYLRQLIISLSQANGIDGTLLIFSHDFWDEGINELVNSVDFAKTMQIFYPFSIQTHPHEFPGESPNDCPRNAKKDQAQRLKCLNADWPDLYGHYREAKFTQTKHHWWWKANTIFDHLRVTKLHEGMVLFLEEDHYVSDDFLHVLSLVDAERTSRYPNCDIICLGTYLKSYNYKRDQKSVEIMPWESAKHNMGMAFKRDLWRKIHSCKEYFCNFDDYNWDWSLQHLSKQCFKSKLEVMLVKGPRVFHIGECGVHHKKRKCEAGTVVKKVQDILSKAKSFMFPTELRVLKAAPKKSKNHKNSKGNGGWGDHRDRALCLNMAATSSYVSRNNSSISQVILP